jgi:hypothetical protein
MHTNKYIDSMTDKYKELLGLENPQDSQIDNEKFASDYEEISTLINDLVNEVIFFN